MNEKILIQIGYVPDPLILASLVEVTVDTSMFMPSMFTIVLEDKSEIPLGNLNLTDNMTKYKIGDPVIIAVISLDVTKNMAPLENQLIMGEVTSIEPIFDKNGKILLRIRGYDRAHRLTRGKKTCTFGAGMVVTDQQIVSKIALDAGLTPVVDPSPLVYQYVMQYNQSDWDFLWSRAQLLGYDLYVDNMILYFKKAGLPRHLTPPTLLSWGDNLVRFEPRLTSMGQVFQTKTVGWDPKTKKNVVANAIAKSINTIGEPLPGPITVKKAFGSAEDVMLTSAAENNITAEVIAAALMDEHESQFVKASGELNTCAPYLLAGTQVIVKNVGLRFGGMYYVTEAKHTWRDGEYKITFQVSGRNPNTIRHLLVGKEPDRGKINGVVVGLVTDLRDPQALGRVKVKFPWMPAYMGSELQSGWARLAVPGGGKNKGIFFTPEINDEVLVVFDHGDINYPFIVGALWNSMDKPPAGTAPVLGNGGSVVNQRIMRSRSGHVIILDDTAGQEQIVIQDKSSKNSIVINSKDNSMLIKSAGDLTIEAGGKFTINSTSDFTVQSKTKSVIQAQTTMELKGGQSAKLEAGASAVDLQMAGATIKGTKVDVQANVQASIQGNAMVQVQGGIVKIN